MPADVPGFHLDEVLDIRIAALDTVAPTGPGTVVIVDPALTSSPHLERILNGGPWVEAVPGEPTVDGVRNTVEAVRGHAPRTVIGIGGGSVIDTGKMVAALVGSSSDITDHLLAARPMTRNVGVIAVPTTAGSGAEATRTSVLSDGGRKTWLQDEALAVDTVLVDPALTIGLPPAPTVASGLDAFVHAVEAYTNRARDRVADRAALSAISTIVHALPRVVGVPDDVGARRDMMISASGAGVAIDRCGTALAHCVGHAIAASSPMPHGMAVALGLRATIDWTMQSGTGRLAGVAQAMGVSHDPDALIGCIDTLFYEVGFDAMTRTHRAVPLDPSVLEAEMTAGENLPMALANARRPAGSDWAELAQKVTDWWNRR